MTINIVTPQFVRTDSQPKPASPPSTQEDWEALKTMDESSLLEMGLHTWLDPKNQKVMLFPAEWYTHIPAGYEVTTISGRQEQFEPGKTDTDIRFGYLAYGVPVM
jgi:hypothetical protein